MVFFCKAYTYDTFGRMTAETDSKGNIPAMPMTQAATVRKRPTPLGPPWSTTRWTGSLP
ncbi:MAG: RHS repeat protein [Lachnospiraceae bacterium]|nr:RHS repeat protein [Lachnospiraceae bacterium]